MNPITRITGALLLVGVLYFTTGIAAGSWAAYIDIPSMILVVGVIVGGLWFCVGPIVAARAITAAVSTGGVRDPRRLALYVSALDRGYHFAWAGGIIGMIAGIIASFQNMEDPSKIGPGMAVGLLTVLYGAVLAELVFAPLRQMLINASDPPSDATNASRTSSLVKLPGPRSMLATGTAVIASVLLMLFILLASLSELKSDDVWRATASDVQRSFGLDASQSEPRDNGQLIERIDAIYEQYRSRQ